MNRFKVFLFIPGLFIILTGSCFFKKKPFGQWTIQNSAKNKDITWAKFYWTNDSLGNKFVLRSAMYIPVKIEGLPYNLSFQFDLGSNLTMIYGENIKSLSLAYPGINFEKPVITFGDFKAITPNCYVRKEYGEALALSAFSDTGNMLIGTLGADMFQDKVLIIDYPNERFSVCDTVSTFFKAAMCDMTLDKYGRIIVPMKLNQKKYNVLFDNGSSIFALLVAAADITDFSVEKNTDTILISSWGKMHNVIGRPLKDSFTLGGQTFSDILVYADYREDFKDSDFDAITGNALFLNKVVIIDFKNKKFGIQ